MSRSSNRALNLHRPRVQKSRELTGRRAVPIGFFTTKIFHPNVSKAGEICVNVLKKDWTEDMGLRHVLVVVRPSAP